MGIARLQDLYKFGLRRYHKLHVQLVAEGRTGDEGRQRNAGVGLSRYGIDLW